MHGVSECVRLVYSFDYSGGGIGGLTLAIALSKNMKDHNQHIHIDLYEAAQEFTEIGAGLGIFPRPMRILEELGVIEELKKLAHIPDENVQG